MGTNVLQQSHQHLSNVFLSAEEDHQNANLKYRLVDPGARDGGGDPRWTRRSRADAGGDDGRVSGRVELWGSSSAATHSNLQLHVYHVTGSDKWSPPNRNSVLGQ